MAAIKYELGTEENMLVDVTDLSGQITDFTAVNARVSVRRPSPDDTYVYEDRATPVLHDPVTLKDTILPLIVTTEIGAGLNFRLYIRMDTPPETPYLGPIEFDIIDA